MQKKKFRSMFNENKDQFYIVEKNLDLYLMKIQIYFICIKNFRSVFNENTYQFLLRKNSRFVFNKNTD